VLAAAEFPNGSKIAFAIWSAQAIPGDFATERLIWAKDLPFPVPTVEQNADPDVLYWVGCAVAFDPRAQKIARSLAEILNSAGLNWAVLGREEKCTGDLARRTGNEYLFAQMATENVAALDAVKPKVIVTTCPHCFHTIANEYPQFGGNYVMKHHTEFIDELIRDGKIELFLPTPMVRSPTTTPVIWAVIMASSISPQPHSGHRCTLNRGSALGQQFLLWRGGGQFGKMKKKGPNGLARTATVN
jgi:Fe-S oxidoreductase